MCWFDRIVSFVEDLSVDTAAMYVEPVVVNSKYKPVHVIPITSPRLKRNSKQYYSSKRNFRRNKRRRLISPEELIHHLFLIQSLNYKCIVPLSAKFAR